MTAASDVQAGGRELTAEPVVPEPVPAVGDGVSLIPNKVVGRGPVMEAWQK